MQWGTRDPELCNLILYSVRGNVICYKNNCKPRHVTIVGSQVWAVSEERGEKCGEWTERPCDPSHSEADIGQGTGGDHTAHWPLVATSSTQHEDGYYSYYCLVMSHYHVTVSQHGTCITELEVLTWWHMGDAGAWPLVVIRHNHYILMGARCDMGEPV